MGLFGVRGGVGRGGGGYRAPNLEGEVGGDDIGPLI